MSRLVNGERKITNPKPENAGKLLIFCEGHTEYNYLDYFRNYIKNNLRAKYSDIVIEPINAEGNAMHVYNYAEEFLGKDGNASKYMYYEKHLLFETWLVMHFQNLDPYKDNSKREIIKLMRHYLNVTKYTNKIKASRGTIGKILGSNGNEKIRAAIENAKLLEKHWKDTGKDMDKDITQMNPSVDIYKLIERLLDEIVYLCG